MIFGKTRRSLKDQVITIGEDECKKTGDWSELCNGPLSSNQEYWLVYYYLFKSIFLLTGKSFNFSSVG